MNGTARNSNVFGCTVVMVLILVSALTADVGAISLYSVIARAAEADVHIVVLLPDEEKDNGKVVVNDRIRFTCDINYRIAGTARHGELERCGLIVTDRFIGLVSVTGNRITEETPAAACEKDEAHPLTAVRRSIGRYIRRYSVPLTWCLKAAMSAAQRLITGYFNDGK